MHRVRPAGPRCTWPSEDGELEVVRLLPEHGANVEAKKNDGQTALRVAAEVRHDEVETHCSFY